MRILILILAALSAFSQIPAPGSGGGGASSGLGDPGANGVVYRNGSGTSTTASATEISGTIYCADAGSTDAYACSLSPAPAAYGNGVVYQFKANTANTGAATINFNSLGAKTIKKAAGGVTTDLADNDIRSGQVVTLTYDGTNMQMQSTLGNAASGTSGALVLLEQYTASSSTSLDFTNCISSTYDTYEIHLVGVVPASGGVTLDVRYSTNGGSSYDSTAIYDENEWRFANGVGSGGGGSSGGTSIPLGRSDTLSASTNYGLHGKLTLHVLNNASKYPTLFGALSFFSNGSALTEHVTNAVYKSTTSINAIRFLMSSGNIASGTIRCYGLAK
jgi:hypothetical protein